MFRRDNQRQLILENFGGLKLRVARHIGNGAEIQPVIQDFVRNVAGKHAMNAHLDTRVHFTKLRERREKSVNRAFVHAQGKLAALKAFQFRKAFFDLIAEVHQSLRVIFQKGPGIRETDGPGATDEEGLAERILQLADGQADGGLGAEEALPRARKAAFLRDHQKYLQFTEIHESLPGRLV